MSYVGESSHLNMSYGSVRSPEFDLSGNKQRFQNAQKEGLSEELSVCNDELPKHGRGYFLVFLITFALLGVAAFIGTHNLVEYWSDIESSVSSHSDASDTVIDIPDDSVQYIVASNEYGEFAAPYPWLGNSVLLAEPYKTTTLTLTNDALTNLARYSWSFDIDPNLTLKGSVVNMMFNRTGLVKVTVTVTIDEDTIDEFVASIWVK